MISRTARRPAAPRVVDWLLGTAVALTIAVIVSANEGGQRAPDVLAYLFALGFGGVLLARRSRPRTVLVLTVLGLFVYYIRDYPPIGLAVPLVAALFAAADEGLLLWSVGSGIVAFTVAMYYWLQTDGKPLEFLLGYESVSNVALIAAAIALGYSVRSRRLSALQQAEIRRLTTLQSSRDADRRIQSERERISRDLHDTVGHTLSVISLQANVAGEAVGQDDVLAGESLDRIRQASRQSLGDLRSMVRILRSAADPDEQNRGVLSLSAVPDLASSARAAGVEVTTEISADPVNLAPPVDAAAYRVIQESITNVVRHAGATTARVTAEVHDGMLHVCVVDNGRGPADPASPRGHGLEGMTERVRLLGGTLSTRSPGGRGFIVEAALPVRLES